MSAKRWFELLELFMKILPSVAAILAFVAGETMQGILWLILARLWMMGDKK